MTSARCCRFALSKPMSRARGGQGWGLLPPVAATCRGERDSDVEPGAAGDSLWPGASGHRRFVVTVGKCLPVTTNPSPATFHGRLRCQTSCGLKPSCVVTRRGTVPRQHGGRRSQGGLHRMWPNGHCNGWWAHRRRVHGTDQHHWKRPVVGGCAACKHWSACLLEMERLPFTNAHRCHR